MEVRRGRGRFWLPTAVLAAGLALSFAWLTSGGGYRAVSPGRIGDVRDGVHSSDRPFGPDLEAPRRPDVKTQPTSNVGPADGHRATRVIVRMLDTDGRRGAMAGALVYLLPSALEGVDEMERLTEFGYSSADGSVEVRGRGPYTIGVVGEGRFQPTTRSVDVHDGEDVVVDVERGRSIRGVVRDRANGASIRNAKLAIDVPTPRSSRAPEHAWQFPGFGRAFAGGVFVHADAATASFTVDGLATSTLSVSGQADGYCTAKMEVAADAETVELLLDRSAIVVVRPEPLPTGERTLFVQFRDANSDKVVFWKSVRTQDGRIELGSEIIPGDYRVSVEDLGATWWGGPVRVARLGESIELSPRMSDLGGVRLAKEDGATFHGAVVLRGAAYPMDLLRDAQGLGPEYRILPGRYAIRYDDDVGFWTALSIDVPAGGALVVAMLALRPTAHIVAVGSVRLRFSRAEGFSDGEPTVWRSGVRVASGVELALEANDVVCVPVRPPVEVTWGSGRGQTIRLVGADSYEASAAGVVASHR